LLRPTGHVYCKDTKVLSSGRNIKSTYSLVLLLVQ
jgi:hypothetical protein